MLCNRTTVRSLFLLKRPYFRNVKLLQHIAFVVTVEISQC
jgi:hypothetical protein